MEYDLSPARIAKVEAEARVLRAQAARRGVQALMNSLSRLVASLFGQRTNAA